MQTETIPFCKTGYFSKLICDYLAKDTAVKPFYNQYPDLDGFKKQIAEKRLSFDSASRAILVQALENQYERFSITDETKRNIQLLEQENTFTVTTGHQLNLFTGPLYFLYKILSTINLAERLRLEYPEAHFVPVYWMATEDHDFEEINYFNFKGKKIHWNLESRGAVGNLSTQELDSVFEAFSAQLPNTPDADHLRDLFKKGYLEHKTLTDATRYIANELFGKFGLVIIDGDDRALKDLFAPYMEEELTRQTSYKEVSQTIAELEKEYNIQVNPREINLFYLTETSRDRIVFEKDRFQVVNSGINWTTEEILKELYEFPERFSPNVIIRPLYQEVILPNLCYIGGGGELAYWLELKAFFDKVEIPFPVLLLRNSVLLLAEKQALKSAKLNISIEELFLNTGDLVSKKVRESSSLVIDFSSQREFLKKQFAELEKIAEQTDRSFIGAVKAQTKKQLNGLDKLEKRLLKAEKKKHAELSGQISKLKEELFPGGGLQERTKNFSEFYLEYGEKLITALKEDLDPLKLEFSLNTL
ncbi:MAG: bacillithiol biosynthesis cysteine-adding enzyme BshC [Flavobacteriaceae bacterium]|nr:bacillithiol biosynthesis cysteine-adding enzyme BshC [Flavobacteriaceae bacterium]